MTMERLTESKIVLVTRRTRLAELVVRYNTVGQARFYIEHLGADFSDYLSEDERYHQAVMEAERTLSELGRVQTIERGFLPNFIFGDDDLVIALGQDGLVANTVKYLSGQRLIGVNPDPARWDGKLLPFAVGDLAKIVPEVLQKGRATKSVTMAKASLNNGQALYAVNDLFIGPKSHISARYTIAINGRQEEQSSSGVIVSTGLGSTGWFKSLLTGALGIAHTIDHGGMGAAKPGSKTKSSSPRKMEDAGLPARSEFPWDAQYLYYTVREPFPSQRTSATVIFGQVTREQPLVLTSQMAENGVIFSDGIEKDFLEFNSGTKALITLAEREGNLVV